jgi:benzoyl-CoA reductase/2-hydroxyglutaryl-CoA dehydratase subunit BcrC/BadD/HgdB
MATQAWPWHPSSTAKNAFRLALVGGPLLGADCEIFDAVEKIGARFVLDATEGGERTLPARFDPQRTREDPLGELTDAYFAAMPDVFQRPNDAMHRWLARKLAARRVQAIVVQRCVWCDLWHAETDRIRQSCSLPVLELTAVGEEATARGDVGRLESLLEILQ